MLIFHSRWFIIFISFPFFKHWEDFFNDVVHILLSASGRSLLCLSIYSLIFSFSFSELFSFSSSEWYLYQFCPYRLFFHFFCWDFCINFLHNLLDDKYLIDNIILFLFFNSLIILFHFSCRKRCWHSSKSF